MNGNFPEAIGAAIVLLVVVFGVIVGVIISHAEAPRITISRPEEHDPAGV